MRRCEQLPTALHQQVKIIIQSFLFGYSKAFLVNIVFLLSNRIKQLIAQPLTHKFLYTYVVNELYQLKFDF